MLYVVHQNQAEHCNMAVTKQERNNFQFTRRLCSDRSNIIPLLLTMHTVEEDARWYWNGTTLTSTGRETQGKDTILQDRMCCCFSWKNITFFRVGDCAASDGELVKPLVCRIIFWEASSLFMVVLCIKGIISGLNTEALTVTEKGLFNNGQHLHSKGYELNRSFNDS